MKRRLLIIAVFLLLGAVVNVAVAWGCALWGPPLPYVGPTTPAGMWHRPVPNDWPRPVVRKIQSNFGHTRIVTYSHPRLLSRDPPRGYFTLRRDRLGFPSRCLEAEVQVRRPLLREFTGQRVERLGALRAPPSWRPRSPIALLPLRPIWPGFAVNTLLYATLLWLLIPGPFALRRFLRLRRGLCPKCAYPIGESSVCTECGGALA